MKRALFAGMSLALAFAAVTTIRTFKPVPLESVSETTANASIGDLNGDGHLDIVLAKGRHWPLPDVVLFGDGKGRFTIGGTFGDPKWPTRNVAVADLNGDGWFGRSVCRLLDRESTSRDGEGVGELDHAAQ